MAAILLNSRRVFLNKIVWIVLLSLVLNYSYAQSLRAQQIAAHIQNLLTQNDHDIDLGIMVKTVPQGVVWYQQNAKRAYVPASTTKLFTATAALLQLGADHQFHTQLKARNRVHKGVLESSLYIRFEGDPKLSSDDLRALVKQLKQQGIQRVKGRVYIDDSALSAPDYGPGWMWDDSAFCFAGPIGALAIDGNCFHVTVKPAVHAKQPLSLVLSQPQPYIRLSNYAKTQTKKSVDCFLDVRANANNDYTVRGCMMTKDAAKEWDLAITNPRSYAKEIIRYLFAEQQIQIPRVIHFAKAPTDTVVLAEHRSPPLSELIAAMLKDSDNLIAGIVFKTLGASYYHKTGNWRNGAKALQAILADKLNDSLKAVVILDGTGLSRYNLITPQALVNLLEYIAASPFADKLMQALAIAGVDGTLQMRMQSPEIKQHVRAKTGTMTHISALAGYIDHHSGSTLAFVIMMNHLSGATIDSQQLQDKICHYLRFV